MSSSIRVSNLPKNATEDLIHTLFLAFGNIINTKKGPNYIDIQFQEIEDANAAIDNMRGYLLEDRYLQVTHLAEFSELDAVEEKKPIWGVQ